MKRFTITACCAVFLVSTPAVAFAGDPSKEYFVKAAMLTNFIKYVEWPDGWAISKRDNVNICLFGESQISSARSIFKKASSSTLAISLIEETSIANLAKNCHVVFIGNDKVDEAEAVIAALKNTPILTVSEASNFIYRGGMISLVVDDNKVKFSVNPKNASASGLRMDAQLLEIASKVIDR